MINLKISKIESKPNEKKKLRVAAYCRVSTDSDAQTDSFDAQKAHYESWIKIHDNWEFAGLFYDFGVTGTKTEHRDGLQNLLLECRAGKIDYILTKSISRFSRNTTDCIFLVRELLDMNIPIYFEKENIDTGSMESEFVLSILSSMAQDESRSISENNKWSVRQRFENGKYQFSCVPYGYMRDNEGFMVINPEEAEIVRFIYQSVLNGLGSEKIAKILEERQIPTRKSGKWTNSTVRDILTNEKYYGAAVFQKTYTNESFHRKKNYGEVDRYFVEEHHEPIISKEIFERVKEIIEQRASEKRIISGSDKYQKRYVFSGIIFCGECGDKFRRKIHDSGKEIAWSCRTHIQDKKKCSMKYIRDDMLKAAFVTMMNKLIYSRKQLLLPLYENISIQDNDESICRIHSIQNELQKLSEKKDTLRKLRAQDIIDSVVFNQEINFIDAQASEYRAELSDLSGKTKDFSELNKLIHFTDREMMTAFNEEVFCMFVSKIVIVNRNCAEFHLKCGLKVKEAL